jgi:uncharacterized membrane protein YjgN (DUF898 family)
MNMMSSYRPAPIQPEFDHRGGAFFGIALRGGLLQIATLGFYRFWLLTDLRRHLWGSTRIEGEALEYTGRARELLIGFLIAMAILAPLFLVYFLIGIEAESWRSFASLPFYGFLYVFAQYAAYRARRYRLSRTAWRGVRFWMEKGGWRYAALSGGTMLLSILTIGLYAPWRAAALERYKFSRTRYGDIPASFAGTGMQLYNAGILYWVVGAMTVVAVFGVGMAEHGPQEADGKYVLPLWFAFLALGGAIALALCYALYQAAQWRWFLNGMRIGQARVESRFPRGRLLGLYLIYGLIATAITIGFALLFALGALAFASTQGHLDLEFDLGRPWVAMAPLGAGVVVYLLLLTVLGVFYRYFLQHNLWRAAVETMTLHGLETLAHARAAGQAVNALGEGLLDGLDMGGF